MSENRPENKELAVIAGQLNNPAVKKQFSDALGKMIPVDRFVRVALTTIGQSETLQKCTTQSLMKALVQSGQLGLEPDGILGRGYLVPYYNSKISGYEAQFQIGYKGLIELAKRSGEILDIYARAVYEKDELIFEQGLNEKLVHRPTMGVRGPLVAAYAVAKFRDGSHTFEVLTGEDVEKVKKASKSRTRDGSLVGPWVDWEEEQWKKTAIKKLAKRLPLTVSDFNKAAELDEAIDMQLDTTGAFTPAPAAEPLESVKSGIKEHLSKRRSSKVEKEESSQASPEQISMIMNMAAKKGVTATEICAQCAIEKIEDLEAGACGNVLAWLSEFQGA